MKKTYHFRGWVIQWAEVQWAATMDVIDGRLISAFSLLALAIVGMLERRERRV